MDKKTNQLAAIEDLTVLSADDKIEIVAGCETDAPPPPLENALELSVVPATEAIAAGCQIDEIQE